VENGVREWEMVSNLKTFDIAATDEKSINRLSAA